MKIFYPVVLLCVFSFGCNSSKTHSSPYSTPQPMQPIGVKTTTGKPVKIDLPAGVTSRPKPPPIPDSANVRPHKPGPGYVWRNARYHWIANKWVLTRGYWRK